MPSISPRALQFHINPSRAVLRGILSSQPSVHLFTNSSASSLGMTPIFATYLGYGVAGLVLFGLVKAIHFFWRGSQSPLHDLAGPLHDLGISLEGDFYDFRDTFAHTARRAQWLKEYGPVFAFRGLLGAPTMMISDATTLNHILTNPVFRKPSDMAYTLSRLVGPGVLVVEGDVHKHQRRIMNPAFGLIHIREMTEIFVEKSEELETILSSQVKRGGGKLSTDMLMWLNRTTLDIIGLAGFGYKFDALSDSEPSELNVALATMFKAGHTPFALLQSAIPVLRPVPTPEGRKVNQAQETLKRIGAQLLEDAKAVAMSSDEDIKGRSLLSLLLRANLATDGPKLSDEAVLAQVPTFFVAGHETTSTATTWTLFALSQAPEVQNKLRQELRTLPSNPTMDQLNSLPYLENVVREVLRLHAPVPGTMRSTTEDVVLPVSEPYQDREGKARFEIRMAKGDLVVIPILAMNHSEDIWGPDVLKFNPDRWNSPPPKVKALPGVYANLLSFLGGPHACIGYRFALVEWKAILFALLRTFEFELSVPVEAIASDTSLVQHPFLRDDKSRKHQMPMTIRFAD